jgi:hypothetical protein
VGVAYSVMSFDLLFVVLGLLSMGVGVLNGLFSVGMAPMTLRFVTLSHDGATRSKYDYFVFK